MIDQRRGTLATPTAGGRGRAREPVSAMLAQIVQSWQIVHRWQIVSGDLSMPRESEHRLQVEA
jgi:hypothetical protein